MTNYYTSVVLSLLTLCILGNGSWAQNFNQTAEFLKANSHRAWGDSILLDFNSGSPTVSSTAMKAQEGTATVSDRVTGELLFYTNGEQVWNASHDVMPNGDSLLGNSKYGLLPPWNSLATLGMGSTVQGACIVPVIGESDKYYLFSLAGMTNLPNDWALGSLFYSIVDMSLDNGRGDIVTGMKNIPLNHDILSESMIAIPGENCDVWLMVHDDEESSFLAYHIAQDGIDTVPIISNPGGPSTPYGYLASFMTVSPDRTKIAVGKATLAGNVLCEFDPVTGQVSNAFGLSSNGTSTTEGIMCFSPDGTKVYSYRKDSVTQNLYRLFQYDVSIHDSTAVDGSRSIVDPDSNYQYSQIFLYNDTIYANHYALDSFIHRINTSNQPANNIVVERDAISLWKESKLMSDANQVVFPMAPDTLSILAMDTAICPRSELTLLPAGGYELVEWSNGSTDSTLGVTEPGIYWALQTDGCHYYVDSFILETIPFPEPVITINVLELGTVVTTYASYQWMLNGSIIPNATQPTYTVSENGDYQVIVANAEGCIDTSEVYEVTNSAINEIRSLADKITIYPNPAKSLVRINTPIPLNYMLVSLEGKTLRSYERSNMISIEGLAEGVYFLKLYDQRNRLIKTEKIIKVR